MNKTSISLDGAASPARDPRRGPAAGTSPAPATRYDLVALKRANPLDRVARAYGLDLKRSGARRFTAFCPFHDDRHTPNLVLDLRHRDDEHFHCYAAHCRAHGDVVHLVMGLENVDFRTACALLDGKAAPVGSHRRLPGQQPGPAAHPAGHGQLGPERGTPTGRFSERPMRHWDRLGFEEQTVMNIAGAVYRRSLWQHSEALRYLHGRGLPPWLLRRCALGWADGESLALALRRGRDPQLLPLAVELGLLRRAPGGGLRDALAGRVVVPELRYGHSIWFIGRGLDRGGGTPYSPAKYLALPGERPALGQA